MFINFARKQSVFGHILKQQQQQTLSLISPRINSTFRRFQSINVAVVGSGPAGFYTTQKLLKHPEVKVDIYEKLPVPFGLVRYGVAPDHADVKNVIKSFTNVANNERVHFYGNVNLGHSVTLDNLIEAYHAVVLCYGSAQDKLLNIDGETSKNTISARNFVGWYNGVPEDKDLDVNLDCDTACIIGQGNVALDCARILLNPANIEKTDITSYAQRTIAKNRIKRLYIIGRRGPLQVSFTIKELRELISLNQGRTRLEPEGIFEDANVTLKEVVKLPRQRRRLIELMFNLSTNVKKDISKLDGVELIFKFLSKPTKINVDSSTGSVRSLELQQTAFQSADDFLEQDARPQDLDQHESIDCGLIIRSIGYKSVMIDKNLPVNRKLGAIMNTNGRIHGFKSLYCSGWLATGASGVIAGTLNSSHLTAQSIMEDINEKNLPNLTREKPGFKSIQGILSQNSVKVVHFKDWLRIDELERRLGEAMGKTREKFVDIEKMLDIACNQMNKPQ